MRRCQAKPRRADPTNLPRYFCDISCIPGTRPFEAIAFEAAAFHVHFIAIPHHQDLRTTGELIKSLQHWKDWCRHLSGMHDFGTWLSNTMCVAKMIVLVVA